MAVFFFDYFVFLFGGWVKLHSQKLSFSQIEDVIVDGIDGGGEGGGGGVGNVRVLITLTSKEIQFTMSHNPTMPFDLCSAVCVRESFQ